jgi:serine/threonine-protein kinase
MGDDSQPPGPPSSVHQEQQVAESDATGEFIRAEAPTLVDPLISEQTEELRPPRVTTQLTGSIDAHVIDGRYELIALLGQGGMGTVYKARDIALDDVIALKTLKQELVDDLSAVERFRAEVKLARQVTHRNVARTFDLGICDGVPYLTMEFVEGEDLAALLARKRRLSVARFMEIAEGLCRGLAAAHAVGVIHRDLKPQNVIVASDGRVMLTDFGIAHATQSDQRLTGEGMPLGTPAYMAPEQAQGIEVLDQRADIYALGVIFFEMFTSKLPFEGKTPMAMALARLLDDAPKVRELRADLPGGVAAVIDRCLARERDARFETADDVLDALRGAHARLPGNGEAPTGSRISTRSSGAMTETFVPFAATRAERDDGITRVAVLPFRTAGGAEDGAQDPAAHAYIADGLTEDLIDELSMSQTLKVRPRGAVMHYRDTRKSPREIGEALSVHVIVDGSIRRAGDELRVRVALVSVEDGFQIWAKRFRASAAGLFEVSEQAARAIAEALTADALATPQPRPADSGAVELYLRARHRMHASWFSEDMRGAVELFEQALAQAPDDPRILAGAATTRARATFYDEANRTEHLQRAQAYAERALSVAPTRPEPHMALALVHSTRLEYGAAVAHLRQIIARAPSYADAHDLLGRILRETGPIDAAIRHLEIALELNPHLYRARWDLVFALAMTGRFDEVDRLLALPVPDGDAQNIREATRTRTDTWRPDPQWLDADENRPLTPQSPTIRVMCKYRREVLRTGKVTQEHETYYARALATSTPGSRLNLVIRQIAAEGFALTGQHPRALAEAEHAVDAGLADLIWLDHCPVFNPIRNHPQFRTLRGRVADRVAKMMR